MQKNKNKEERIKINLIFSRKRKNSLKNTKKESKTKKNEKILLLYNSNQFLFKNSQ